MLSAPSYAAIKLPGEQSTIRLTQVSRRWEGGFSVERKVCCGYDMPKELTAELKRNADLQETCAITINPLELRGVVVVARVMLELVGDSSDAAGDPILVRGDSMAAESWLSPSGGGVTDKRACLPMIMLGRLELAGGWNHNVKHIPGVQNTSAGGVPRWPRVILAGKVRELTHSSERYGQPIVPRGSGIFDVVLQTKNILTKHDDILLTVRMNEAEELR